MRRMVEHVGEAMMAAMMRRSDDYRGIRRNGWCRNPWGSPLNSPVPTIQPALLNATASSSIHSGASISVLRSVMAPATHTRWLGGWPHHALRRHHDVVSRYPRGVSVRGYHRGQFRHGSRHPRLTLMGAVCPSGAGASAEPQGARL